MLKCFAKCFLIAAFAMSGIATQQGCLCMQSNAMLRVSSLTCKNGEIGYFLLNFSDTGMEVIKKLNFKEICEREHWTQDLPKTQDELKILFENILDPATKNVFRKTGTELICCCLNHGNLDAKFQKLRDFVALLEKVESKDKKQIIRYMGVALVDSFVDFETAIQEHREENEGTDSNDDFLFPLLREKLMELNPMLETVGCGID